MPSTPRKYCAWNASLKFAAENYEWGRHLSKLRLKFYTDANVSKARYIDVVIDAQRSTMPRRLTHAVKVHNTQWYR
jgi:hypothetical protein